MVRAFVSRGQKKVKVLESDAHYCSEKILYLVIYFLDYLEAIVHTGGLRGSCKLVQVLVQSRIFWHFVFRMSISSHNTSRCHSSFLRERSGVPEDLVTSERSVS